MRQVGWSIALVFVMMVGSQPVWARTRVHEAAESPQYGRKFGGMLGRGVLNIATSFVDVIVNVVNDTKAGPPFIGTLTGVAKGTGCGLLRLGSGAVDIVTSWVPGFNGFPVSDSYADCLAVNPSVASIDESTVDYRAPVAAWDVPTAEPAAAQVPEIIESTPLVKDEPSRRQWKK